MTAAMGPEGVNLPFDLDDVLRNLREERYPQDPAAYSEWITGSETLRQFYYFVRPVLPVGVRRHIQKIPLSDWRQILFPAWPVDVTVETLMESVMTLVLKNRGGEIPFVWFWPDGAKSAVTVTHDVEGAAGGEFCDALMSLDDSYGIKAAFQIVPEGRRALPAAMIERIRERGFEVNVHDLNHDGHLFSSREAFVERAARINEHARRLGAEGFRSGSMYREVEWFDALDLSYDMSVPNAAHLEPQRGGCCTVMPYFLGEMVEIPLTTVQDLGRIPGTLIKMLPKKDVEAIQARRAVSQQRHEVAETERLRRNPRPAPASRASGGHYVGNFDVVEVVERWRTPLESGFRVRAGNGRCYVLRNRNLGDGESEWVADLVAG